MFYWNTVLEQKASLTPPFWKVKCSSLWIWDQFRVSLKMFKWRIWLPGNSSQISGKDLNRVLVLEVSCPFTLLREAIVNIWSAQQLNLLGGKMCGWNATTNGHKTEPVCFDTVHHHLPLSKNIFFPFFFKYKWDRSLREPHLHSTFSHGKVSKVLTCKFNRVSEVVL